MIRQLNTKNQSGLASIVIVAVLVVLLSLITLGFSRLMQRSAIDTLNNQLATAASYAAQSGINDAVKFIKTNSTTATTTCNNTVLSQSLAQAANISGDNNTKLTCLLINPTPSDLMYQQLPVNASKVVKLTTVGAVLLGKTMVSWQAHDSSQSSFPTWTNFKDITSWQGYTPLLQVTLYPVPASGDISNVSSKSFFLYPQSSNNNTISSINYNSQADGSVKQVYCSHSSSDASRNPGASFNGTADYDCNVIISNMGNGGTSYYYIKMTPIYNSADVKLKANDTAGAGNIVKFQDVQTVLDVTAKANTAIKRIQERVDSNTSGDNISSSIANSSFPEDGLRSAMAICKRLNITASPTNAAVQGGYCSSNEFAPTNPPAPSVAATNATNISPNVATLNGWVNPNGWAVTSCYFQINNQNISCAQSAASLGSGNSAESVSGYINGLNPNTTYQYKLCAGNAYNNPVCSNAASFTTTNPPPPTVATGGANVSGTSATLNGLVNPNGWPVNNCFFQYGTSTNYSLAVGCGQAPGAGIGFAPVSANISGLSGGTTYYYRLCAGNGYNALVCGNGSSFATALQQPDVVISSVSWDSNSQNLAMSGYVNDHGASGTVAWFHYIQCGSGDAYARYFYSFPTGPQGVPANYGNNSVSQNINPFSFYYCGYNNPSTFQLCAQTPGGSPVCSDTYNMYDSGNGFPTGGGGTGGGGGSGGGGGQVGLPPQCNTWSINDNHNYYPTGSVYGNCSNADVVQYEAYFRVYDGSAWCDTGTTVQGGPIFQYVSHFRQIIMYGDVLGYNAFSPGPVDGGWKNANLSSGAGAGDRCS